MAKHEKLVTQELRSSLESGYVCLTEKLHGNIYQSGLPDLLVAWPDGQLILVEVKYGNAPEPWAVAERLGGRQRGVIFRLGVRHVPVFVVGRKEGSWWLFDARQARLIPESWKIKSFTSVAAVTAHLNRVRHGENT